MRVPEAVGVGSAKLTISFDAWKDGNVASTSHEIPIVLPKNAGLKLVDVSPGIQKELIHPNKSAVSSLENIQFSPDGKRLIAGDYPGGVVAVWDVATGKRISTIETGHGFRSSSRYFFVTPDWKTLFVNRPGKRKVDNVEKDGRQFRKWTYDGAVHAWDLDSGKLSRTYEHDPPRYVSMMTLSPDGTRFFASEWLPGVVEGRSEVAATLWNAGTGKYIDLGKNLLGRVQFSPNGRILAIATMTKDNYTSEMKLLNTVNGQSLLTMPVNQKNVHASVMGFSPNGKYILVSFAVYEKAKEWKNYDFQIKVRETATGKEIASLAADKNGSLTAYFSPDSQTLAVTNTRRREPNLRLFDILENRVTKTIPLGEAMKGDLLMVHEPVFSPDGKRLAVVTQPIPEAGSDDPDILDMPQPCIQLIDVSSGKIRQTLVAPQGFSSSIGFSPDGNTLAVGSHGRVLLWDVSQVHK